MREHLLCNCCQYVESDDTYYVTYVYISYTVNTQKQLDDNGTHLIDYECF